MNITEYLGGTKEIADRPLLFRSIKPDAKLRIAGDRVEVDVRGLLFVMVSVIQEVDNGTCDIAIEGTVAGEGWNLISSLTEAHFSVGPKQAAATPVGSVGSVVHYAAIRVHLKRHSGVGEYSVEVAGFKIAEAE